MNKVFGNIYSNLYDLFYKDKDYEKECNYIEKIFQEYQDKKVKSVLDLGCGTGNYAIPLINRGYKITGVDLSEYMLDCARSKTVKLKKVSSFVQGDVKKIKLKSKYDSAIMMFAVLGYQIENEDVISTLKNIRSHINPGGLLVFDVWFGPAVLHNRPTTRVRTFQIPGGGKIIRIASGDLDILGHNCQVNYQILKIGKKTGCEEFDEHHTMRYFFTQEIKLFLNFSGFKLLKIGKFPDYEKSPTENDWNIMIIAKAV